MPFQLRLPLHEDIRAQAGRDEQGVPDNLARVSETKNQPVFDRRAARRFIAGCKMKAEVARNTGNKLVSVTYPSGIIT